MISAVSAVTQSNPSRDHQRVGKAAHEFEAQLLSILLAPLEKSFSSVPGEDSLAGAENYGFMGIQALSTALSNSGGIGISDLLVRQLERTEVPGVVSSKVSRR